MDSQNTVIFHKISIFTKKSKMKNIIIIISAILLSFNVYSQEKINWLSITEFEKTLIKGGEHNCLIFIEDEKLSKKDNELLRKDISKFLENKETVKYINQNFICYKFNPSSKMIKFLGKEYKRVKDKKGSYHEFTNFLTTKDKNVFPALVLRDSEFNLFKYQEMAPANADVAKLVKSGKRRMPVTISVLPFSNHYDKKWFKTLIYFSRDHYKKQDLESFIRYYK